MVAPMSDARIKSFLADVLALEGESAEAIRDGVHIALQLQLPFSRFSILNQLPWMGLSLTVTE